MGVTANSDYTFKEETVESDSISYNLEGTANSNPRNIVGKVVVDSPQTVIAKHATALLG